MSHYLSIEGVEPLIGQKEGNLAGGLQVVEIWPNGGSKTKLLVTYNVIEEEGRYVVYSDRRERLSKPSGNMSEALWKAFGLAEKFIYEEIVRQNYLPKFKQNNGRKYIMSILRREEEEIQRIVDCAEKAERTGFRRRATGKYLKVTAAAG